MKPKLKSNLKCLLFTSLTLVSTFAHAEPPVNDLIRGFESQSYMPTFRSCSLADGTSVTQIRSFQIKLSNRVVKNSALIVDGDSLETSVVSNAELLNCRETYAPHTLNNFQGQNSDYIHALAKLSSENIKSIKNAGSTHAIQSQRKLYLTVDLCPSHKALDVELFKKIQGGVKPVPVLIAISGLWIMNHTIDLSKLQQMEADGEIKITWANHSYSHPYNPKSPLDHNFLLETGVNFEDEVFKNEKLLLSHGIVPSVFFRFPGLVSNQEDIELLRQWGLIPLGANAWLALGEKPSFGSFILVHGNGNEPKGLKLLYEEMTRNPDIKNEFSDIHEAFDQ